MASHENQINQTGWSTLSVITSDEFPDIFQAYWAGYLETNITYDLTKAHMANLQEGFCPKPLTNDCVILKLWLTVNIDYMIKSFLYRGYGDEFWYQIGLHLWQIKGMADAYNHKFVRNSSELTSSYLTQLKDDVFGIYALQLNGDLDELTTSLKLSNVYKKKSTWVTQKAGSFSCSALIKLIPDDIMISHVTWSGYQMMLRVLKIYRFPWKKRKDDRNRVPGEVISFSSYPSFTSSIDDFYITSTKLVVTETTIGNDNKDLWVFVRDGAESSVLYFYRVMAANRLAQTGREWALYFRQENSGTYNNQWMVVDAKLFSTAQPLPREGVLVVAEQLPGIVWIEDKTDVLLSQMYWPSYNLPYYSVISNLSGISQKVAKYGNLYDYNEAPRAKIFRRDNVKAIDLQSFYQLMRYNNYKEDPLSRCNCTPPYSADLAISSRSDLNDPNGTYPLKNLGFRLHGGTDVKITNYKLLQTMDFIAASGPTFSSSIPPFQWSKLPIHFETPQLHPDLWKFEPFATNFSNLLQTSDRSMRKPAAPTLVSAFQPGSSVL
ncbi:LAMA protein 2 [Fasciolopsis buskii]|uniref:Phospholipase B-like n=1 Tax=Fasciolopsis buskii TaxID=27845 RepID=A0A8E0RJJ3_9TREM|nr:LAMA protein 2 [Fasciolopsis buski]